MVWLVAALILIVAVFSWTYRFHLFSFYTYLSARFEHRRKNFQLLSSLRESLIHEKKKIVGLEMIPSSWERREEIQPRFEYFWELLEQLKSIVCSDRTGVRSNLPARLWGFPRPACTAR